MMVVEILAACALCAVPATLPASASASALPTAVAPAAAPDAPAPAIEPAPPAPRWMARVDAFASTDADGTEVLRTGIDLDLANEAGDRYQGVRLEKALFRPLGQQSVGFERAYLRYADKIGRWSLKGQAGTDGRVAMGTLSAALEGPWRKELFIERDIVETPRGVREGIYYTFVGLALDVPLGERDSAAFVAGAQEFTGRNVRLHLRGQYVHMVKPAWGLSAQLRGRYFLSTKPGEFDYFSPRWYAQALPVLQVRRFSGGWRYLLAGGYGAQRDAHSSWRPSRYLNAQVTSPTRGKLGLDAGLLYSNTPVGSGFVYDYLQGSLGLTVRL